MQGCIVGALVDLTLLPITHSCFNLPYYEAKRLIKRAKRERTTYIMDIKILNYKSIK